MNFPGSILLQKLRRIKLSFPARDDGQIQIQIQRGQHPHHAGHARPCGTQRPWRPGDGAAWCGEHVLPVFDPP